MDDKQSRVDRLFTHHYVNRYEGSHVPCYDARDFIVDLKDTKHEMKNQYFLMHF